MSLSSSQNHKINQLNDGLRAFIEEQIFQRSNLAINNPATIGYKCHYFEKQKTRRFVSFDNYITIQQGQKNEMKGDPEIGRMSELIMLPENSCAFTTAIDMVRYSNFLKKVDVKEQKFPELIKTLKLQSDSDMKKTIREIYDWGLDHNGELQPIGRYQDPWIIINCILLMLAEIQRSEDQVKSLFPILECSCRNQNKLRLKRNPEYVRSDMGGVRLRNLICQYCGIISRALPIRIYSGVVLILQPIKMVNPKTAFITHRMSILRIKDSLKLNKNLFNIFLQPITYKQPSYYWIQMPLFRKKENPSICAL